MVGVRDTEVQGVESYGSRTTGSYTGTVGWALGADPAPITGAMSNQDPRCTQKPIYSEYTVPLFFHFFTPH